MQNTKSTLSSIILAFRPKTLTAALVPCVVGSVLAFQQQGKFQWVYFACALLSSFFIQIGTNLVNDAVDFKKGADTEKRVGPQRITQSGILSAQQVLNLAYSSFACAFLLGIPLVIAGGWPIVAIGLFSIAMAYAYTGGPYPLAYNGLGDLFVVIFFGWIAVGGMYYLHTGTYDFPAFILGTQIGLLAAVLIAINNLRDHETDRLVQKNTLAVRLGVQGARLEIALLAILPFVLNFFWSYEGYILAGVFPLFTVWIAEKIVKGVYRNEPGPIYNRFLGMAAALHLAFGISWSLGAIFK